MIEVNADTIIEKIIAKTSLPHAMIAAKIDEKMRQLSGLLSREGAAHIIANEYGVQAQELFSVQPLKIKNIASNMRDLELNGQVTRVYELREFKKENRSGKVASFVLVDDTGTVRVTLWGNQAEKIRELKEGLTVHLKSAYSKENNGFIEVHLNDKSTLEVSGEAAAVSLAPQRRQIKDLQDAENNVEIMGTIVQFFEPRFFETCSQCNKRVHARDEGFYCDAHQKIEPRHSYVLNVSLDDGSDIIRIVCFQNQADKLLHTTEENLRALKNDVQQMEMIKNGLLGKTVKLVGKVQKNQMFDRTEFVAQLVYDDINVEEELQRVKTQLAAL